jgi:hypothetical protein
MAEESNIKKSFWSFILKKEVFNYAEDFNKQLKKDRESKTTFFEKNKDEE